MKTRKRLMCFGIIMIVLSCDSGKTMNETLHSNVNETFDLTSCYTSITDRKDLIAVLINNIDIHDSVQKINGYVKIRPESSTLPSSYNLVGISCILIVENLLESKSIKLADDEFEHICKESKKLPDVRKSDKISNFTVNDLRIVKRKMLAAMNSATDYKGNLKKVILEFKTMADADKLDYLTIGK